jgi:hypothetical protein
MPDFVVAKIGYFVVGYYVDGGCTVTLPTKVNTTVDHNGYTYNVLNYQDSAWIDEK